MVNDELNRLVAMKMHETIDLGDGALKILRVPGGFIYTAIWCDSNNLKNPASSTFVPARHDSRSEQMYSRAVRSLQEAGFTDEGGELWKPPVNRQTRREDRHRILDLQRKLNAAMEYIKLSPSDPDYTPGQMKAWERMKELGLLP